MTQAVRNREMPKTYDPGATEDRIYESWMAGGYFTPEIDNSKAPFTVIMPPPNVTGELHYGHALTIALEDLMCRWHRMKGEPTLYLPGTDHAGIATQVVVERMLASDDLTRHDLGRREFVATVWRWVDQYGDRIIRADQAARRVLRLVTAGVHAGRRAKQGRADHLREPLREGADIPGASAS